MEIAQLIITITQSFIRFNSFLGGFIFTKNNLLVFY